MLPLNVSKTMKQFLALCFLGLAIYPATLSAQYKSTAQKKAFLLDLCKKYCPNGQIILEALSDDPEEYMAYVEKESDTREELLDDLTFVVHEGCHGYHNKISDWGEEAYFLGGDLLFRISIPELPATHTLLKNTPASVQKDVFRFSLYAGAASKGNGSDVNGLYGLLEEMTAYYIECDAMIGLYDYTRTFCEDKNFACWGNGYFRRPASNLSALYEFRLMMALYLKELKSKYPEKYRIVMEDRTLKIVFTLLDEKFSELEKKYLVILTQQVARMNKAGLKVELKDDYIYVESKNGGSHGYGLFLEYNKNIEKMLTKSLEVELDALRIDNLKPADYLKYIAKSEN